ncbi:hypothetical protein H4R35_000643 [Dimargaris xerosporica]|nr:hypothetical protein H4R35_000643 [Dimargaris xerosporica]
MSSYIQYFLEPELLRRDIPDVSATDKPPAAVQAKARSLLDHVLARNQFPEFHSKHPSLPGPAVPSTPLVSPVLSPASAPVRIPTAMARVWIQRDPVTGLPLAASLPFSWGQTSHLPLTPGDEQPLAISTAVNPASPGQVQITPPLPDQDALTNAPLPSPTLEVSPKQQRLLQLAAEAIELAQLPLDVVEAACGVPIQALLFAYALASKDGQLVHTPKAIPTYRHFLTLYHRWVLRRYCRDRSLLVDWTGSLACHVHYLHNSLTAVSTETSPPLWTLYVALDLAQYHLATLDFSRANQTLMHCQALVAVHQNQVQSWVQQMIRNGLAACQQALHPSTHCPKSMDDPTAVFLWVESRVQAGPSNRPSTMHPLPEACEALDWPTVQAWLLADIVDQSLTRAYRVALVHRCVVAQQPCTAAAVDLCNFMDALYNQLELSPTLYSSTQTWLTQQPLPKALEWVQAFFKAATQLTKWQHSHRAPVDASRFASVVGFTCIELERLLSAPEKLCPVLQSEPDALYYQTYAQLRNHNVNQAPSISLTTRILVPSIYKTNDPSPSVLLKLGFELLAKESYQSASASFNRLLSVQTSPSTAAPNQGSPNLSQVTTHATEQPSPGPQDIQFYLIVTRVLLLTTAPTGQEDDTLWAQLLDDILQQHAQLPFKVVLRLALYCIQRHRWADIVRVIRWITQHKQDFVQHGKQLL